MLFVYSGIKYRQIRLDRAVTKPVVGVFDLASNVSEGRMITPDNQLLLTVLKGFEILQPYLTTRKEIGRDWYVHRILVTHILLNIKERSLEPFQLMVF